jgi:hypothetical protein
VQLGSLAQLYSSKSDDELLWLAADPDSLVEQARPILAEELRRRALVIQPALRTVGEQAPNLSSTAAVKPIRTFFAFLLNLATAIFGTALLESFILPNIGFSRSVAEWEVRAWVFSFTLAALLGFLTFRQWPQESAMWVWTLPVAFLTFGALAYMGQEGSVIGGDSFWKHFIAPNCSDRQSCRDFLIFTVPLARSVGYSAAAWVTSHFQKI